MNSTRQEVSLYQSAIQSTFKLKKTIAYNRKRLHAIVNKNRRAELYRNRVGIFKQRI